MNQRRIERKENSSGGFDLCVIEEVPVEHREDPYKVQVHRIKGGDAGASLTFWKTVRSVAEVAVFILERKVEGQQ